MAITINKPIQVGAVFKSASIKPVWFIWEGRKYYIEKINLSWQKVEGETLIHLFSVLSGQNLYELSFNTKNIMWRLNKIEDI